MRYLILYLHFLRFSFSRAMQFRLDFYFRVVMDIVFYAVSLGFFTVLYRHTQLLGGWSLDQTYLFVCGFLLVDALHMAIFANNLWWLPILINRGDLDYYLTRPVSSLFFLSLREFAANSFLNVLISAGLVVWAIRRFPENLGPGPIVAFVFFLLLGTGIHYLIRMIFIIPVFWLHSAGGLIQVSWSLHQLAFRPTQIFSGWLRLLLLTVVPLAFLATVPAEVLFEGLDGRRLLHATAVTLPLAAFVFWFWQRGLRAYSSASS